MYADDTRRDIVLPKAVESFKTLLEAVALGMVNVGTDEYKCFNILQICKGGVCTEYTSDALKRDVLKDLVNLYSEYLDGRLYGISYRFFYDKETVSEGWIGEYSPVYTESQKCVALFKLQEACKDIPETSDGCVGSTLLYIRTKGYDNVGMLENPIEAQVRRVVRRFLKISHHESTRYKIYDDSADKETEYDYTQFKDFIIDVTNHVIKYVCGSVTEFIVTTWTVENPSDVTTLLYCPDKGKRPPVINDVLFYGVMLETLKTLVSVHPVINGVIDVLKTELVETHYRAV